MPAGLQYQITGNVSGLAAAASQATGILNNLQNTANQLNIKLFSAETVSDINGIGGALTIVNNKIQEYLTNAIKGSQAFKDQQAQAALDSLANKLAVLTGNQQIFGESVKNSQAQINAYQSAINSLLSAGLSPFDDKVKILKSDIDRLTKSIADQKAAAAAAAAQPPITPATLGLIEQAEQEVRDLQTALKKAGSVNEIVLLNQRLTTTRQNLSDLRGIGANASQTLITAGSSAQRAGAGINSFNLEIGRVVQDLPFAANNFGAIGNNLTRLPEVFASYRAGLVATIEAQGRAVTSGNLLRTGISGLFTGISGLSLALSLAVSAYTFYQQAQQRSEREAAKHKSAIDEQKKALEDYIDTLNASARAEAGAFSNVADSITKLNEEVYAIKNNTGALFDGLTARQAIVRDFPAFTKGYDVAKASVEDFTTILEKGTAALEAFGRVQAANDLAKGFQKTQIQNQVAAKGLIKPLSDLEAKLEKLQKGFRFGDDFDETLGPALRGLSAIRKQINSYNTEAAKAGATAKAFYDVANQELPDASDGKIAKPEKVKNDTVDPFIAISNALDDIIRKNNEIAKQSGLQGYALEVQKIKDNYANINAEIDKQSAALDRLAKRKNLTPAQRGELVTNRNKVTIARSSALGAQDKELGDAQIREAERVSSEIQRINNEFGVKQEQSRNRELAGVQKLYDAEVIKAQGNKDILEALAEGRLASIDAINAKYLAKEKQLQDSIVALNEGAAAELNDKQGQRTDRIVAEWDRRKVAAARYFDELRKIAPERTQQFNAQQSQLNNLFDAVKFRKVSEELSKNFASAMQQGINSFASNFYTAITTLGEQRSAIDLKYDLQLEQAADESTKNQINRLRELEQQSTTSFGAIFSSLTQGLFQTFNKSIFDSFTKQLTENLGTTLISGQTGTQIASNTIQTAGINFAASVASAAASFSAAAGLASATTATGAANAAGTLTTGAANAGQQLSKGVSGALAGLSVLGGLVSGIAPKTSAVGQGLGGALSGVGTGALIGSVIPGIGTVVGGVIGGVVGALGGIFGAGKAKKQEELQRQQLAEQKKQTDYLRQQSLAYTSAIIGRVTSEGTVTGVNVDAMGKVVFEIEGKNLKAVIDRNSKSRV